MRSLVLILITLAVTVASLVAGGFLTIQLHNPLNGREDRALQQYADRTPYEALREAERERVVQEQEVLDAITQTNIEIALEVQRWFEKPRAYGGGGGYFAGVTLAGLGYPTTGPQEYATLDATFTLKATRHSATITGMNLDLGLHVETAVVGTGAEDIMTAVSRL